MAIAAPSLVVVEVPSEVVLFAVDAIRFPVGDTIGVLLSLSSQPRELGESDDGRISAFRLSGDRDDVTADCKT